eukprot:GCRY01005316.1.p1 GENE.GCRY01005316.1~~GCRY01005316.1.p1  ORF type:complete len:471 (+),score=111.03 GCRY01005316.1:218-1630(+)
MFPQLESSLAFDFVSAKRRTNCVALLANHTLTLKDAKLKLLFSFDLHNCTFEPHRKDNYLELSISPEFNDFQKQDAKVFNLYFEGKEELQKWISALKRSVEYARETTISQQGRLHAAGAALRLGLEARRLPKMDSGIFGKADPFFKLSAVQESGERELLFLSGVQFQTLNPVWEPFDYVHVSDEAFSRLQIDVYDWDDDGQHDYIGSASFFEKDLLHPGRVMHLQAKNGGCVGSLILRSSELIISESQIPPTSPAVQAWTIVLEGVKMKNRDTTLVGRNDPFLQLSFRGHCLYRGPVFMNTPSPVFAFTLTRVLAALALTASSELKIEVFDWNANGHYLLIGAATVRLYELFFPRYVIALTRPAGSGGGAGKASGRLVVRSVDALPLVPESVMEDMTKFHQMKSGGGFFFLLLFLKKKTQTVECCIVSIYYYCMDLFVCICSCLTVLLGTALQLKREAVSVCVCVCVCVY